MSTTRQRLIDAAFGLFDEQGFDSTTVDQIAERAGVGRTTFFRHFRSKEDVIFPDHEALLSAIRERLEAASPDTALVAVVEGAGLVLRYYLGEGQRARSRYELTRTVATLRAREIAGIQQYQQLFRDYLLQWMRHRPDAALRAELMANAVVTAHNHVLRRWLRGRTDSPLAELDAALSWVVALFDPPEPDTDAAVLVLRTRADLERLLPRIQGMLR